MNEVKEIKFKVVDDTATNTTSIIQTKFPKTKKKRIQKKWNKKHFVREHNPIYAFVLVGMDIDNGIFYGKVHPEFYELEFKTKSEEYNSNPDLPDMVLVGD